MPWKNVRTIILATAISAAVLGYFGVVAASTILNIVRADSCGASHPADPS